MPGHEDMKDENDGLRFIDERLNNINQVYVYVHGKIFHYYYARTRTPFCYLLRNATLNYATLRHNSLSPTGPHRKGRCTSDHPSHHFSIVSCSFTPY